MSPVRKAFLRWVALRPDPGKKCCEPPHYTLPGWEPLHDDFVCERERAWRDYVRLRDRNKEYPFRRPRPQMTQQSAN